MNFLRRLDKNPLIEAQIMHGRPIITLNTVKSPSSGRSSNLIQPLGPRMMAKAITTTTVIMHIKINLKFRFSHLNLRCISFYFFYS